MILESKRFKIIAVVIVMAVVLGLIMPVIAEEPYISYGYDWFFETYPVQNGYVVERVITGNDLTIDGERVTLNSPRDIFVFRDEVTEETTIFIVDSGNNRIIVTDENFDNAREMRTFTYREDYRVENFVVDDTPETELLKAVDGKPDLAKYGV